MEDDKIIVDPSDNSDVSNETPDLDNSQAKVEDENIDYKKRYSDSTKESQKILLENKRVNREVKINTSFRKVLKDNSYLLELDEDLAKDVVKQLHEDGYAETDSLEELLKALQPEEDATSKPVNADDLAKQIRQQLKDEDKVNEANKLIDDSLSKYTDEEKEQYRKEFEEVLGDRKLTPAFAKREMEKIVFFHKKESIKKERNDNALAGLASNPIGSSKSTTKTQMTLGKLKSLGVPESQQKKMYPELFTK